MSSIAKNNIKTTERNSEKEQIEEYKRKWITRALLYSLIIVLNQEGADSHSGAILHVRGVRAAINTGTGSPLFLAETNKAIQGVSENFEIIITRLIGKTIESIN
ncbi:hypothetical protein WA026_016877 [Henosepilachna vigintioctopunctata]|uniref:Uncharacterized protein n=1 Tax=Henosepilachna vigintioctopunctata TaxID=420089 RepID=A0AAW1U3J0_9CUCU